jgi:hypothetical protein
MTTISYVVPPGTSSGQGRQATTGAYGDAFELALNAVTNKDGSVTDTLTYKGYKGGTDGSFSAASETASGSDFSNAYSTLFAAMQANGDMSDSVASELGGAAGALDSQSHGGTQSATVSGGQMLVLAGGPTSFSGISSAQNTAVDSIIDDLFKQLTNNSTST